MARWLFKEEPTHYSFQDLQRDGVARWDGVKNALALKNLRQARAGDTVFFYHTGKEKAVVGEMVVREGPREGVKEVVVEVAPVRLLAHPVSLARIKADPVFEGWELVRLPRLSVMPVSEAQWKRVQELSERPG